MSEAALFLWLTKRKVDGLLSVTFLVKRDNENKTTTTTTTITATILYEGIV